MRIHLNLSRRLREAEQRERNGSARAIPPSPDVQGVSRDALMVNAAIEYLRSHLAAPPSPEQLAVMLGTNETRLNQAFNAGCGLPVFGWLREERMAQARALLVTTDTSIAAIGDYLGFSSASNFAKAFRERFAMSPRALRQARHAPDAQSDVPAAANATQSPA